MTLILFCCLLQIGQISKFVTSVNGVLRAQEETALVEKTMKKIVGYNPFEIPSDFKEVQTNE